MRRRRGRIEDEIPHNIAGMIAKFDNSHTRFNVPKHARHVTGARDYLSVIDEPTTAEVTGVGTQFAGASDAVGFPTIEIVNGTNIVQTTTSDEISRW